MAGNCSRIFTTVDDFCVDEADNRADIPIVSQVELAVEKVRNLNQDQVKALLDWLKLRERPEALRQRIDEEIEIGLKDVREGRVFTGEQVHSEIRERSRKIRESQNA